MTEKTQHKPDAYDIVGDVVKDFWRNIGHPCDCIAYFDMKYDWETIWDNNYQELVTCYGSDDFETVIFENDFCEGQTDVKNIKIVPLDVVTDYYYSHVAMDEEVEQ